MRARRLPHSSRARTIPLPTSGAAWRILHDVGTPGTTDSSRRTVATASKTGLGLVDSAWLVDGVQAFFVALFPTGRKPNHAVTESRRRPQQQEKSPAPHQRPRQYNRRADRDDLRKKTSCRRDLTAHFSPASTVENSARAFGATAR